MYNNYKSGRVGDEMKSTAKGVNLRRFLEDEYPAKIHCDAKSNQYHLAGDPQTNIGLDGFKNYNTNHKGDQIQFLRDYCGMMYCDAVRTLYIYAQNNPENMLSPEERGEGTRKFMPPARALEKYKCVWSYLVYTRNIPREIVEDMFREEELYQSMEYNNCVFLSNRCEFAEIHGTSTDIPFKRLAKGCEENGYWSTGNENAETCYICKSAIDAVSLMALHKKYCPDRGDSLYVSACGLNPAVIERIINEGYKNVILAFPEIDQAERLHYEFELHYITPGKDISVDGRKLTDWNDILMFCDDEKLIKDKIDNVRFDELPF